MRPEDAADMPARKEQALPEAVSSLAGQGYGLGRTIFSRLISFQKLSNTVAVFFEQRRTSGINDEFFNKVTCRCGENAFWQKCVGPFCVARRSAGPGTRFLCATPVFRRGAFCFERNAVLMRSWGTDFLPSLGAGGCGKSRCGTKAGVYSRTPYCRSSSTT